MHVFQAYLLTWLLLMVFAICVAPLALKGIVPAPPCPGDSGRTEPGPGPSRIPSCLLAVAGLMLFAAALGGYYVGLRLM